MARRHLAAGSGCSRLKGDECLPGMKLRLRSLPRLPDALVFFLATLHLVLVLLEYFPLSISCHQSISRENQYHHGTAGCCPTSSNQSQLVITTSIPYYFERHGSIVRLYFLFSPSLIYKGPRGSATIV
jgi:hypothetical protein